MDATSKSIPGVLTLTFPTFPSSVPYEPDLEALCRAAAWIGASGGGQAPLSFFAILIALLWSSDSSSMWFQKYVVAARINRAKILNVKQATDEARISIQARAQSGELPNLEPLMSQSARNIFTAASELANLVASSSPSTSPIPLGVRHVLAAYTFRTPLDHLSQLSDHGFDLKDWQTQLMAFLRTEYLGEHWNRLVNPNDPPNPSELSPEDVSSQALRSASVFSETDSKQEPTQARNQNVKITPNTDTLNLKASASAGTASSTAHTTEGGDSPGNTSGTISLNIPVSASIGISDSNPIEPPAPIQTSVPGPLVGRYTADDPYATADDLLNIETEASAFARIVAARSVRPPLAIGIFGEWGSGKTYFMRRIQSQVEQLRLSRQAADVSGLFYSDIVQIRFNAWHYIETNLWASLVEYIFSALDTWIQQKASGDQKRTDLIFNRLATAQQLQIDALENVVKLRAQQHSAELRAQRARQDYADALAKSTRVKPDAYLRAMLDIFLTSEPAAKECLETIGKDLAIPQLEIESDRLAEILAQARSEAGRAKLVTRSLVSKLGTWPAIITIVLVVLALPVLAVLLEALAEHMPALAWIKNANIQIAAGLLAATGIARIALSRVRAAVKNLTAFDERLQKSIDQQIADAKSPALTEALASKDALLKSKQAVEIAERALLEANAKLASARQEFESGTARGRLNAFVRAKVTDGDYAKHLGIIASIRKDFVQLASLMNEANDTDEERKERLRLREEATLRVRRFLSWLKEASEVRLTLAEVSGLFKLLDPLDAVLVFDAYLSVVQGHFDGTAEELNALKLELQATQAIELPRFSRIVLYIDDLDRCPPAKVVDVLQAVHLLLCFPLFVVIVAVDARWVSRALHERFPGLLAQVDAAQPARRQVVAGDEQSGNASLPPSGASSDDYLEKIFQIPYWVRPMEAKAAADYVLMIAGGDRLVPNLPPKRGQTPVTPAVSTPSAAAPADIAPVVLPAMASAPIPHETIIPAEPAFVAAAPEPVAIGMTLTDWEIAALNAFAPFVGSTPRHAIRFVNVYRLIKTSLSLETLDAADLEEGKSPGSRALIPQLAIVTGAKAAQAYFRDLQMADGGQSVEEFIAPGPTGTPAKQWVHDPAISGVFATLIRREGPANPFGVLRVSDLQFMAPTAQRFSFTARLRESRSSGTTP